MSGPRRDPWSVLQSRTPARIGLGRCGISLPTREVLAFGLAHAQARDAVHASFDSTALAATLSALGLMTIEVDSEATERSHYLRRPDLGRRLSEASRARVSGLKSKRCDLALVVGDGLSASAVAAHAPALIAAFLPLAAKLGLKLGPVAIATGARVALGDEIGVLLKARAIAVLIGERPGLSSADSLGVYLTYDPRPGRNDAERNCISNIRPEGLSIAVAAFKLAWLIDASLARGLSGVALKDDSETALPRDKAAPSVGKRAAD